MPSGNRNCSKRRADLARSSICDHLNAVVNARTIICALPPSLQGGADRRLLLLKKGGPEIPTHSEFMEHFQHLKACREL
eukprot:3188714-Amphidinium_carterae.1